jgi:ABC-type nitrate/sulfonate/bicarbonate transport system permease component
VSIQPVRVSGAGGQTDSKRIFAGILFIAILGIGFDTILRRIQRVLDPRGQASG